MTVYYTTKDDRYLRAKAEAEGDPNRFADLHLCRDGVYRSEAERERWEEGWARTSALLR